MIYIKKYQKLVHNRCARCNLCNLNNADVGNVDIVDNIDIKLEQSYFDGFSNMDTIVSQSDETHYLESTSKIPPSPPCFCMIQTFVPQAFCLHVCILFHVGMCFAIFASFCASFLFLHLYLYVHLF